MNARGTNDQKPYQNDNNYHFDKVFGSTNSLMDGVINQRRSNRAISF
jgi:hypothetical protein